MTAERRARRFRVAVFRGHGDPGYSGAPTMFLVTDTERSEWHPDARGGRLGPVQRFAMTLPAAFDIIRVWLAEEAEWAAVTS